jgi:hypothetical protein
MKPVPTNPTCQVQSNILKVQDPMMDLTGLDIILTTIIA